jgi:hypothetical protein
MIQQSLFEEETNQLFTNRVKQLNANSKALWGKMTVADMLWHCSIPLEAASGKLIPKTNKLVKFLFGKMAKRQFMRNQSFKKNLPTFSEAKSKGKHDFNTERDKLVTSIQNFKTHGIQGLTSIDHPFFGHLSVGEWDNLMVIHLNHHLNQFGV